MTSSWMIRSDLSALNVINRTQPENHFDDITWCTYTCASVHLFNWVTLHICSVIPISHTDSVLSCPKCGKQFPTKPTMRRHMSLHDTDDKRETQCYICRLNFRDICGLRVHLGKEHKLIASTGRSEFRDKKLVNGPHVEGAPKKVRKNWCTES